MENHYLYIEGNTVNYADNAFSGIAHFDDNEKKINLFTKFAADWRHSKLGNFTPFSHKKREEIAKRWEAAKDLPEGKYDYYFNLESKGKAFKQHVKELADKLGIKYELKIIKI